MSTITENDIRELKSFIVEQFKEVNQKIDKSSEQVNKRIDTLSKDIDTKIDKLSENLHKEIKQLSEDVNNLRVEVANVKGELTGVNKRLDNLDFTNRTIFVAIVTALMAGLVKLFLPNFTS